MDALVSDKIYKEVKDVSGIDKIESTSSLGVSTLVLTLKTSADAKDVMNDVRNHVNRVTLPSDAKTPNITEIETNTNQIFSVFLYDTTNTKSRAVLIDRAKRLQKELEVIPGVDSIDLASENLASAGVAVWGGGDSTTYDVTIVIPKEKLESLGLSLQSIANAIRAVNLDQPIGNFSLWDKKYDYRIEGKSSMSFDFLDTPITLPSWSSIKLSEIARIERKYKDTSVNTIMLGTGSLPYSFIGLTVNKTDAASIFSASDGVKSRVDAVMKTEAFHGIGYVYGNDMAELIRDDYKDLMKEWLTTLILVFIAMYLFVGFKDSLFATLTLPLAFLATFLILSYFGYSLNFLTNFSFILSFGIAVDTIIVIVQAASAKLRIGYSPRSAIMLALREYAIPIISWVSTTIVVFIPMMLLPWIMGKFLAYIPITIFWVLASGLVLALTVNSALYLLFVREKKTYVESDAVLEYAEESEKELLVLEREGKTRLEQSSAPLRTRLLHNATEWYKRVLRNFLEHKTLRRVSIFLPVLFLILSFVFLAPIVGFNLFPSDDNNMSIFTVEWPVWLTTEAMRERLWDWTKYFTGHSEIEYISTSVNGNRASITVQLTKKLTRKARWEMDVFTLEPLLYKKLVVLESQGLKVTSEVIANGPPWGKAIGLKLEAEKASDLPQLIAVSKDFQNHLKSLTGTKNVGTSSADTPGQFVLSLKKDLLAQYGIPPSVIYSQIVQSMNGITVWTVEDNGNDMDVVLKVDTFLSGAMMEDVMNIPFTVWPNSYRVGDFVDTKVANAIASVSRTDGKIEITVDADLEIGGDTVTKQAEFESFAQSYDFPLWISYSRGWENEENKELIVAVFTSFFLAIMFIFAILTLQFNSFSQPAIILYSVIMSLPVVMIGLLITGNQFSMPFGIGFIAFTGIAVNHGIILISAINENLEKWMKGITALVEAGSSRLEPMTLTTLTTVLGMIPIALKDQFWAGMGFTIIFGIISASFLTLFVVKGIYYEIYMRRKEGKDRKTYRNNTISDNPSTIPDKE